LALKPTPNGTAAVFSNKIFIEHSRPDFTCNKNLLDAMTNRHQGAKFIYWTEF